MVVLDNLVAQVQSTKLNKKLGYVHAIWGSYFPDSCLSLCEQWDGNVSFLIPVNAPFLIALPLIIT
jgi:hypothetical protein